MLLSLISTSMIYATPITTTNINKQKNLKANNSLKIDKLLRQIIQQKKLTGKPDSELSIPDINRPKAQHDMKLFFSKTLGGDKTTACASCHHPLLGGGDNLSLPIGTGSKKPDILGHKRKLKPNKSIDVPRNAPTTFNVAFWKKSLFHDMRIERVSNYSIHTPDLPYPKIDPLSGEDLVQAQARFPITSSAEMRGDFMKESLNQTVRRALADRLKKNWLNEFRKGFSSPNETADDLITEQNFSEAISAYERSQVFINNPWKKYIDGDLQAISESAKKGALLFFTPQKKGGAGCSRCHSGNFFTDEKAYNTAMPQIGSGKSNEKNKTNDYGCNLITKKESDKFKFRTPTLLNVEMTGPWGHDGAYTSLEAITKHMLSPIISAKNYQPSQLQQKGIMLRDYEKNTLEAIQAGVDILPKPNLKKSDTTNLVSFLKTLTDPCIKSKECLTAWIPNKTNNDPDGKTLYARDIKITSLETID